ncbi:MAG TPA: Fe-S cluster assembly protein SufD [Chloroflexi bacterium]|nr:Fe-S cluster assembly protein SufD [Chloroflexota bacterium]|tara:strand:- start:646 stop:1971 length:1326 start_codon:yes stop_codon:yes gene_type:complete
MTSRNNHKNVIEITDSQLVNLSRQLGDGDWYVDQRKKARKIFNGIDFPTIEDEAWRRTDIERIDWNSFLSGYADNNNIKDIKLDVPNHLLNPLVDDDHGGQIVVSGGNVVGSNVSADIEEQGVIFCDFVTATNKHSDLLNKYLSKLVDVDSGKHAAMAATFVDQGVFLYVPAGVSVSTPLHSVFWLTQSAHFSRVVVVVEDGASLTYAHELASDSQEEHLHSGTVEVYVGDNSEFKFVELQSLSSKCYHFSHERCQVGRNGQFDWVFSAIGSKLTKSFLDLDLLGDGAWGRMSGFYFAAEDQHMDHDTQQNHYGEGQTSDLLFKGALKDDSRSVWQGMINVEPGAQKTDGFQANRNLLLSKEARADSIPGLEIQADDVRCTHAATISRLEDEHLFYLMSRGIHFDEAKKVVVDGFFDPIMQRVPFEGVRNRLKQAVVDKMM